MFSKVLTVGFLVLCCMAPLRAQDHPATSVFDELPPCETDVLEAYKAEIVPRLWILYLPDASTFDDPWWAIRVVASDIFAPGFNMPPCKDALWLRDATMATMYTIAIAQQARYGDEDTAEWMTGITDDLVAATMQIAPSVYEDNQTLIDAVFKLMETLEGI